MNKTAICAFFVALMVFLSVPACAGGRYLILDFDCSGKAAGESKSVGRELRSHVQKGGGSLVSRDLLAKVLKQKGLIESDLNYRIDELKDLLPVLGAEAAVYGHIYGYEEMFVIELRYLSSDSPEPILFNPVVCGSIEDIHTVVPEMANMILSPDKTPPHVVSVEPSDGQADVGQYADLKIEFSEPMNPSTFSISAVPEDMWQRYGDVVYDDGSNSFTIKMHLYPDIEYEFFINGEDSKGFKDLAGNPAPMYRWFFKTGR
jgi:hypothetical protein